MSEAAEVIGFWQAAGMAKWFARDDGFDAQFERRFRDLHFSAARQELEGWMQSADGALALLLLLDQFPRNCFRGSAHSYATDGLALHYARRALDAGFDTRVAPELRMFFYLPFEHSEAIADQERAMQLFADSGNQELLKYAALHRDLIARFGRFPHRNAALGRESTQEEIDYLADGGFKG